ncbi:hypothetical protein RHGRI_031207 [Rhododendron griersonianum]|uniref:Uncharacterized protein n=1 Tax=Rhododendron griersonianum TaxID=479676 RepID=A0AAV6I9N2_9ERIC|nr:hypothetical protein RHGRI_031207 [Rhododendron griersonianum]
MMSRGATRVIRSVVGPSRCFSTAAARTIGTDSASAKILNGAAGFFPLNPGKASERAAVTWIRFPVMGARNASTVALDAKEQKEEEKVETGSAGGVAGGTGGTDDKAIIHNDVGSASLLGLRITPGRGTVLISAESKIIQLRLKNGIWRVSVTKKALPIHQGLRDEAEGPTFPGPP